MTNHRERGGVRKTRSSQQSTGSARSLSESPAKSVVSLEVKFLLRCPLSRHRTILCYLAGRIPWMGGRGGTTSSENPTGLRYVEV